LTAPLLDLAGEPWCFPPETVARMTDRQIELWRTAQADKIKAAEEPTGPGGAACVGPKAERERNIQILESFGMSRAEAETAVDRAGG